MVRDEYDWSTTGTGRDVETWRTRLDGNHIRLFDRYWRTLVGSTREQEGVWMGT